MQVDSQQRLLALAAAVTESRWIEAATVTSWYSRFREWLHACVSTQSVALAGGATFSCIGRDCAANGTLIFPYCTAAKFPRDASGARRTDANGVPLPGAAESKAMVLASGAAAPDDTPLADAYVPAASFYVYLDQFLADTSAGASLASNLRWVVPAVSRSVTEAAAGLSAAQLRANYKYYNKADDQIACMRELRLSVESAQVGAGKASYPYTFPYIFYEQFAIIRREAMTNLALALVAVFFITSVIIASVHASLMVVLCVIMVDIDILGLMHMWGLTIDSVTIINLVLAVGLAVDYSAHIAHAFVVAKGTRQERLAGYTPVSRRLHDGDTTVTRR